jgi:hypothetical protein
VPISLLVGLFYKVYMHFFLVCNLILSIDTTKEPALTTWEDPRPAYYASHKNPNESNADVNKNSSNKQSSIPHASASPYPPTQVNAGTNNKTSSSSPYPPLTSSKDDAKLSFPEPMPVPPSSSSSPYLPQPSNHSGYPAYPYADNKNQGSHHGGPPQPHNYNSYVGDSQAARPTQASDSSEGKKKKGLIGKLAKFGAVSGGMSGHHGHHGHHKPGLGKLGGGLALGGLGGVVSIL